MGRKILFVTTDQQRHDALGCTGGTIARTPVVDTLAANGIVYNRAHNQNTVCMPARSTMITGQYVRTHGVVANGIPLPADAPSVAGYLHETAGYRTALIGKAHFQPGFDVDTHFAPTYDPWDQRMCFVPDGDLLNAIAAGQASVVTDHVERFVERGVQLRSGRVLDADLIVTATGLNMLALGGIDLAVDGRGVEPGERMSYRGMLLSGVPNLAVAFGYTNASWTLKCDLTCAYVCRLLSYMDEHGYVQCTPTNDDPSIAEEPFMDFSSGYVQRAIHLFPKQGSKRPWRLHQNYALDILSLRYSALDDGALRFSRRSSRASAGAPGQAQAALA